MTIENIGLFKGLTAKMAYMDQRQSVIAQNVANSDTPGYIAHDLKPVDFSTVLGKAAGDHFSSVIPARTHAGHMSGSNDVDDPKNREQREAYEIAPAGNAVILEEQMIKAGKTTMDYNLMTRLYQKNVGMIRMALGSGK